MDSLFDLLGDAPPFRQAPGRMTSSTAVTGWDPSIPPPSLRAHGIKQIALDFETNGLKWWRKDFKPVGAGVCLPDGSTHYLAWGHAEGNNVSEPQAQEWFRRELPGVHIDNLNTKFEVHTARAWGINLESMGCTVSDAGHWAALLDDHRREHSLKAIVRDYLPDEAKVEEVDGTVIDASRMASYHAGIIAVRACGDVRQVHKLREVMLPQMNAQDLMQVKELEDEAIYVTEEMEWNGTLINVPLLHQWRKECIAEWKACLHRIYKRTGLSINPTSNPEMTKLFKHIGLTAVEFTDSGLISFKADALKKFGHDENIADALKAKQLMSLDSKYLKKYEENIDSDGLLRFALHQLRAQKEDESDRSAGTITGRYSSSAFSFPGESTWGVNIQQVFKVEKQIARFGDRYIIRQLHVPASGLHLSADAMQIEYRIFASLANTPAVIKAYREDPLMSFHEFMHGLIKPFRPDFTYRQQKDLNFAVIYAAGLAKMAYMLGLITENQMAMLKAERARGTHPLLKTTAEIRRIYDDVVPEVKGLLARASHLAKEHCDEWCNPKDSLHAKWQHRGWVATILGRRMRFPGGQRLHKALNGVIQGSAADINKRKLIELHKARHETKLLMRFTVHDEVDGDVPDLEHAAKVKAILDSQSFPKLKVPILWDVNTGANWREAA